MQTRLPIRIAILAAACVLSLPPRALAQAEFATDDLRVRLDARGSLVSLWDVAGARERLAAGEPATLLSIRAAGQTQAPAAMTYDRRTGVVTLDFRPGGVRVRLRAAAKPTHVVFEIVSAEPAGSVDAVIWGPYPTTVGATVGEIVGVVREGAFALGLQVLNLKTRGGALLNDEGSDPSRGTLAKAAPFGSVLQAFALDRTRPRTVAGWNGQFPDMPVPPMPGETVVGSKIALFASRADRALERIGAIEVAEGAPHLMIDGVWAKQWRDQGRSYLIAAFSESTVDELLGSHEARGSDDALPPRAVRDVGPLRARPQGVPHRRRGHEASGREGPRTGHQDWRAHADELHQYERRVRARRSPTPGWPEPDRARSRPTSTPQPRRSAWPRPPPSPTKRRTGCTRS